MTSATVEFKVSAYGRSAAKGLFGVLELERIADTEVFERTVVRNVRVPVGVSIQAEPVHIGAGKYLGKLRLPTGEHISELVEIAPVQELQRVVLGKSAARKKSTARAAPPKSGVSPLTESRAVNQGKLVLGDFSSKSWSSERELSLYDVSKSLPMPRTAITSDIHLRSEVAVPPAPFVDISPKQVGGGLIAYLDSRKQRAGADSEIKAASVEVLAFAGSSSHLHHRLRQQSEGLINPVTQLINQVGLQESGQHLELVASSSKSARLRINAAGDVFEQSSSYLVLSRTSAHSEGQQPALRASLMRVPGPWFDQRRRKNSGFFLDVGRVASASSPWRLSVDDPAVQSVIDFTQQKDLNGALVVLEMSLELLMMKVENPYAAAAAGYVLMLTPPSRTPLGWFNWIGNLGSWFDELPDGLIQHATLLLQRSWEDQGAELNQPYFPIDERERTQLAADLLLRSIERGLPLYRSGLTLLASNLFILDGSPLLPPEVGRAVARARGYVNGLRRLVDTTQAFTTIDISSLAEMGST